MTLAAYTDDALRRLGTPEAHRELVRRGLEPCAEMKRLLKIRAAVEARRKRHKATSRT